MRVTQSMLYRQTLASLNERQANVMRAQDQISSGTRLSQAKDDPVAMARVMRNDDMLQTLKRHNDNIRILSSRLEFVESELDGVTDIMHRARELMISGANATQSDESRSTLALEMRALGEELLRVANGQDGQGRYLFAGQDDATRPFVDSGGVNYQGSANARQIPVDQTTTMANGLTGDEVFMSGPAGDLFAMFNDLADTLEMPTPDAATTAQRNADMEAGLTRADDALNHILDLRSGLGVDLQRLDSAADRISALQVSLQTDSSGLRDTDVAQTLSQLAQELTALEAAQKTFTRIQSLSLFNYL